MARPGHLRLAATLASLALAAALGAIALPNASAAPASGPIPNGYYFAETGGYRVIDSAEARFWTEFRRLGGVDTLGYPVSRVYRQDGFVYQAFQRGILQWRPETSSAVLSNTFDWLTAASKDPWLHELGIPGPLQDSSNGNWNAALAERLTWLTNEPIRQRFLTNPATGRPWSLAEAVTVYGVPQSRPQQRGPFIAQRFQRIAFQLWTERVPNMPPPGSVVGVLAGDLVKSARLIPELAATPEPGSGATPAPAPTPGRTPTPVPTQAPPPTSAEIATVARYAFDRMNSFRAAGSTPPLVWSEALARVAQAHAESQARANLCSHTGVDGSDIVTRLRRAGLTFTRRGENISCGAAYGRSAREEVDRALAAFMAEPYSIYNHRGNIMNPEHRRAGVGIGPKPNGTGYFFVTNFTD